MKHWLIVCGCICSIGCVQAGSTGDAPPAEDPEETPPATTDHALQCGEGEQSAAYDALDRSVHELVTCGGIQVGLAQSMVGILLTSNERMFDETTRQQLAELEGWLPENVFEPLDDGQWRIVMGTNSNFDLEFLEPTTGARIYEDPFDMESYLVGLRASYTMSFDEMLDRPDDKNTWEFEWDEEGPLAHLLNDGEPVPPQFVIELSLHELVSLVFPGFVNVEQPDLGVFNSLLNVEMSSVINYTDLRGTQEGEATVLYEVHAKRASIGAIAASESLAFDIAKLQSTVGDAELVATESTVAFHNGIGSLSGEIQLQAGEDEVVMDFGEGQSYPDARWTCAD